MINVVFRENREKLENLNELVSLQNEVKALGLQDKLEKQNFHDDMKKNFEPVTKTVIDNSEDVTKVIMETSFFNKTLTNYNDKLFHIKNDRGILASCSLSLLSKISNPKHTSQIKLVKDPDSNRFNDLLINKSIPLTLQNNLLTFHDTDINFELVGNFLKMIVKKTIM